MPAACPCGAASLPTGALCATCAQAADACERCAQDVGRVEVPGPAGADLLCTACHAHAVVAAMESRCSTASANVLVMSRRLAA